MRYRKFSTSEDAFTNLRRAIEVYVPAKDMLGPTPQDHILEAAILYAEKLRDEVALQYEVRVNGT